MVTLRVGAEKDDPQILVAKAKIDSEEADVPTSMPHLCIYLFYPYRGIER